MPVPCNGAGIERGVQKETVQGAVQQLQQEYSDREAFVKVTFHAWNNVSAKLINYTPISIDFLVDKIDDTIY